MKSIKNQYLYLIGCIVQLLNCVNFVLDLSATPTRGHRFRVAIWVTNLQNPGPKVFFPRVYRSIAAGSWDFQECRLSFGPTWAISYLSFEPGFLMGLTNWTFQHRFSTGFEPGFLMFKTKEAGFLQYGVRVFRRMGPDFQSSHFDQDIGVSNWIGRSFESGFSIKSPGLQSGFPIGASNNEQAVVLNQETWDSIRISNQSFNLSQTVSWTRYFTWASKRISTPSFKLSQTMFWTRYFINSPGLRSGFPIGVSIGVSVFHWVAWASIRPIGVSNLVRHCFEPIISITSPGLRAILTSVFQ